jgi:MFS family permease
MRPTIKFRDLVLVAVAAVIGTAIEWYEFFAGAVCAGLVWPHIFLPSTVSPGVAMAFTFATSLVVGLFGRPVGSFVFGHFGDRLGRKYALVWDLLIVGIGSLGIALTPTFSQIGYAAIALVGIFMFLIGFGLGGEWGGATAWVLENAYVLGSKWRAFWSSWVQQGNPMGLLMASSVLGLLAAIYGPSFLTMGWRIVFFTGTFIVVVGIIIRYKIVESVLFEDFKYKYGVARRPSLEVWKYYWWPIVLGILLLIANAGLGYEFIAYSVPYMVGLGYPASFGLFTQAIASLTALFFILSFSVLGDKIGRRLVDIILYSISIPLAFVYPLMLITRNLAMAILAQIMFWGFMTMGTYSVYSSLIPEQFPTKYRYSGAGIAYQLGVAIGGSSASILLSTLIGTQYVAHWWILATISAIYCLLGVITPIFMKETKETKLDQPS